MLCSQPNRGALRRQARIEPRAQEQLGDPWVRLSDRSAEETSRPPFSDRARAEAHVGATMSTEENIAGLDSTVTVEVADAPPDVSPEDATEAPLAKKGPPVAPKPTWFRHSKKKIQEEQRQKVNLDKTPEQKPPGFFSRGLRSASSGANLSLKQRIHSFETFSSPSSQERENRRPLPTSSSIPLVEKEPRRHLGSRDWREPPKEKRNVAALLKETDETTSKPKSPAGTALTSEAPVAESESDQSPLNSSKDLPPEVTTSGPSSDPRCDDSSASPSEPKSEPSEKLCGSPDAEVATPEAPVAPSRPEEDGSPEWREDPAKQVGVTAEPTDTHQSQEDLDGENKILSFSNKVSCYRLPSFRFSLL